MTFENLATLADTAVKEMLQRLPREVAGAMELVPVFLEPEPSADDVAMGIEADTLGLFDEGDSDVPTPRIRLWLLNIWDYAEEDEEIFREEVSITLMHEIGHFLGWDEQEVEERGLG